MSSNGVNKVIIIGRLGQDPEAKAVGQSTVTKLSVATSESWLDKNGQKQEKTEWHRVSVWGKLAEICSKYLTKGRQVYVEGKLQTRSWEDDNGKKQYSTEIVATTVQFIGGSPNASDSGGSRNNSNNKSNRNAKNDHEPQEPEYNEQDSQGAANNSLEPLFNTDDDIPY